MRRALVDEVRAVTEESIVVAVGDGEVTYLLGPAISGGEVAVFGAHTDGTRWVSPSDQAARAVVTHRLAHRDPWLCRFIQMAEEHGFSWDEPDGSTLVAHAVYLPEGRVLHFTDPRTFLEVNGQRSGFAVGYRYGVTVTDGEGCTYHAHSNLTGGAAFALAALFMARYGKEPGIVSSARLAEH
jgi:hypothetical protein